jgi:UDP-galactopyranose mutase
LAEAGIDVEIIERRPHIGGNTYDGYDEHGIWIHHYGAHIFHTNSERVWKFLSRFTEWHPYEHRVLASVNGEFYPVPVNRSTLDLLYPGNSGNPADYREELLNMFYRNYTRKQWGMEIEQLDPGVIARVPMRDNYDDRYFTDKFQALPRDGYTPMFERMVDHPRINLRFNSEDAPQNADHTVYTGPIDAFFGYQFGKLPYRSLRFECEHFEREQFQPVGVVNYPGSEKFTKIAEAKHFTGQKHRGTTIVREYPADHGEPYYPIPTKDNHEHYQRYRELANQRQDVTFVGRLAEYRYYNIDQAVAAAQGKMNALLERFSCYC